MISAVEESSRAIASPSIIPIVALAESSPGYLPILLKHFADMKVTTYSAKDNRISALRSTTAAYCLVGMTKGHLENEHRVVPNAAIIDTTGAAICDYVFERNFQGKKTTLVIRYTVEGNSQPQQIVIPSRIFDISHDSLEGQYEMQYPVRKIDKDCAEEIAEVLVRYPEFIYAHHTRATVENQERDLIILSAKPGTTIDDQFVFGALALIMQKYDFDAKKVSVVVSEPIEEPHFTGDLIYSIRK